MHSNQIRSFFMVDKRVWRHGCGYYACLYMATMIFFRFEEDPGVQKTPARGENVYRNEVWKAGADWL